MKKILSIILLLLSVNTFAQINNEIPNNEFNNWDSETNPSDWSTLEDAVGPGNGKVEMDKKDFRNGEASLKLVTPEPSGFVDYSIVSLGNMYYNSTIHRLVSSGAYYKSRPDSVWILYKYTSPASDSAGIAVTLAVNNNGNPQNILNVLYPIVQSSEWKLKSYALNTRYTSTVNPDSIYVSLFSSASKTRTPNSTLQVDGIYFNNPSNTTVTSVDGILVQKSLNVYPNPLIGGSLLTIKTTENLSGNIFHLIEASGKEMGQYDIDNQNNIQMNFNAAGNYFWFITNKDNRIIAKGKINIVE